MTIRVVAGVPVHDELVRSTTTGRGEDAATPAAIDVAAAPPRGAESSRASNSSIFAAISRSCANGGAVQRGGHETARRHERHKPRQETLTFIDRPPQSCVVRVLPSTMRRRAGGCDAGER